MSSYYWIDKDGNKRITSTNNKAHQTLIEAYIAQYQEVDKDAKPVLAAYNNNNFSTLDTEACWDDSLTAVTLVG